MDRNTCPIHANFRHLVKSINKTLKKEKADLLPVSCRQLATSIMCANDFVTVDPLTWKYECAMRQCDSCPEFKTVLDAAILKKDIQYSQWTSKKTTYKKDGVDVEKDIFGLFSDTTNLETVLELVSEQLEDLCRHIFVAHAQWNAHKVLCGNLDERSVITTEDYQMNKTMEYQQMTTNMSYSTNKVVFSLYPICIEYLSDDGQLRKGALAFLTEDRKHDHQQVQMFEESCFVWSERKFGMTTAGHDFQMDVLGTSSHDTV